MTSRTMYPHGRPQAPLVSGHAGVKFTVLETLDHIKEEFQLFQAQYHSLKLECEKLASEKTEMHRHYIMYYEMSYGLNIEMQKQVSDGTGHQHQVAQAVERSKHVSMAELNAIIGQQQFQHLSHHAPGFPLTPHPSGLTLGVGASLMALPGAFPFPPHLVPKDDLTHPEPLDSRVFDDVLHRLCLQKSASPAGLSPRSTEGNGLTSSPVLRKNPSREGSSSPRSQPRSPLCKSPTQEKVRSPSPSASHESLSPGSPAPPRPLSSSARGPSPALKH
ncbi:amino-terminal enhancer of split-like [Sinocyclocheilus anshuiensis]|uniref:amino-terminal enhancer of split-like n=1 Tax=Sinocyclocheilus anshuiensis TaxID=1608454 RepID=UPI0007B7EC39|nr:PREDICTED: amino-terminal enhancer of split-like [Sinocyclocheilus anshuiensis]